MHGGDDLNDRDDGHNVGDDDDTDSAEQIMTTMATITIRY